MIKIAQKISWLEPIETTVSTVEINRSDTIYGTYSVINTIDATSDGEVKSSSNTWVTVYTDTSGLRTHWYKIRFFDTDQGLYSDYSDPITAEELIRLCTVTEIKRLITTTGRWSDDEVFNTITDVDDLIYLEHGKPLQAVISVIGKINDDIQTRYYVGEEDIYRIDRVFFGTTTKTELFLDDSYRANNEFGMVEILPVASSGITPTTEDEIEMRFVPKLFNKLSQYRTIKRLLEGIDTTTGGAGSKELKVINERLDMVEQLIANRFTLQLSSDVVGYDKYYGVNKHRILQDFDKNRYIGSTGW